MTEEPSSDTEVLVVGAGPTGLTLACELARRKIAVRVIDRAPSPFKGSRGKGLQPRTLEVFEDLGIIEQVLAAGSEYPRLRVHVGPLALPWDLVQRDARTPAVPYPDIWLLPQASTEAILRTKLAQLGVTVELGTELTRLAQDARGVTASLFRDVREERVRARYLVGADGGHSAVRKQLDLALSGRALAGGPMIVGDAQVDGLDRRFWHVWPRTRGGWVTLCPLPRGGLFQLIAQVPEDAEPPQLDASSVAGWVSAAIGRSAPLLRDFTWLSLYRPSARMVSRYRVGRVFVAGDAAHVHPPTGGQGLNLGVQDSYNLGWKLAAVLRGAPDALLDSYQEERLPVAAGVLGLSSAIYGKKLGPQRRGGETKQLDTHYRGRSLSTELRAVSDRRVQAGDRAPDAPCRDTHGAPWRLFEVLRGPHATVLGFGASAARAAHAACERPGIRVYQVAQSADETRALAPDRVLIDADHHLASTYGPVVEDLTVWIRPDGYVGLISGAPAREPLEAYLKRVS